MEGIDLISARSELICGGNRQTFLDGANSTFAGFVWRSEKSHIFLRYVITQCSCNAQNNPYNPTSDKVCLFSVTREVFHKKSVIDQKTHSRASILFSPLGIKHFQAVRSVRSLRNYFLIVSSTKCPILTTEFFASRLFPI